MSASPAPAKKEWSTECEYSSARIEVSADGLHIRTSNDQERGHGYDASCALEAYRTPLPELDGRSVHDLVARYFTNSEASEIQSYVSQLKVAAQPPGGPAAQESGGLLDSVKRLFGSGS